MHGAPTEPPLSGAVTQCATWPTGTRRAGVRCWGVGGKLIQCCGHGLLSCAAHWAVQWPGSGMLELNSVEIPCKKEGDTHWLGFSPVYRETIATPAWVADVLGATPVAAASAGPQDGYLIAEFAANTPLQSITVPDHSLSQFTQRALIVTCRTTAAHHGEGIHYRYFAPQYGSREDTATGSAMRVLASYWQDRGLGPEITALQCSADGGWLRSRVEQDTVWIGGHVAPQLNETTA